MTATLARPATARAPRDAVNARPVPAQLVRPAPRREPPFDDEVDGPALAGPLDRPLPFPVQLQPRTEPPANLPLPRTLPDPARWGHRLLVGIIESAAGQRPLRQLGAMLHQGVANGLRLEFERAAREATRHWTHAATVRNVYATEPTDGIAELNATVQSGKRVRAVAMRLEVTRGRWCCTRLHLG